MSWRYAAAKRAGTSHERSATPCQDAFECEIVPHQNGTALLVVVSDGAGSAAYGGEGASHVCTSMIAQVRSSLPPEQPPVDWLEECALRTRESLLAEAEQRDVKPRDMSATLLCAILTDSWSAFAQVGDGAIVTPEAGTKDWAWLFWPQRGEYANTTIFLTEPAAPERLEVGVLSHPQMEVALFTDGLQNLVLRYDDQAVHSPFFERMMNPLRVAVGEGVDEHLCLELERYLGSEPVSSRTDDDLTLVMATHT
jgi:hypothetical protein